MANEHPFWKRWRALRVRHNLTLDEGAAWFRVSRVSVDNWQRERTGAANEPLRIASLQVLEEIVANGDLPADRIGWSRVERIERMEKLRRASSARIREIMLAKLGTVQVPENDGKRRKKRA